MLKYKVQRAGERDQTGSSLSSKLTFLIPSVSNSRRSAANVLATKGLGFRGLGYCNSFQPFYVPAELDTTYYNEI